MNGGRWAASGVWALWAAAAVLVFWCLGAYNRLVRLRRAVGEAYRDADVDAALGRRHRAAGEWLDACAPDPAVDAARAACRHAEDAARHAALRPTARNPIVRLARAERALGAALAQCPAAAVADPLRDAVVATDAQLAVARERFNAAVAAYNGAAREWPTRVVAVLFGLRPAGPL